MKLALQGDWLRRARLRLWLWCMAACEKRGQHESWAYRFAVRRAMGCNAWRSNWRRSS